MFNETCYELLKKTGYLNRYAANCYIGISCIYIIASLIAVFITLCYDVFQWSYLIAEAVGLLILNWLIFVVLISIGHKKPFICTFAVIESISKTSAELKVGEEKITASSFEKHFSNESLDKYQAGEKVLVYSLDKNMKRPLFTNKFEAKQ